LARASIMPPAGSRSGVSATRRVRQKRGEPQRWLQKDMRPYAAHDQDPELVLPPARLKSPIVGLWRRWLCRFSRSPLYRVEQKLAFSSTDCFSAGLKIPVRIGECTLQLRDARGQTDPVDSECGTRCQPFTFPAAWLLQLRADRVQPAIYSESSWSQDS